MTKPVTNPVRKQKTSIKTGRTIGGSEDETLVDDGIGEMCSAEERELLLRDDMDFEDDDDLAIVWEPTEETDDWIDNDPPVDARVPLGTKFCDEAFGAVHFPTFASVRPASGGLLPAFVESCIEVEAEVTLSRGVCRSSPRPSQKTSGGPCRTLPCVPRGMAPLIDADGIEVMGPEGEPA